MARLGTQRGINAMPDGVAGVVQLLSDAGRKLEDAAKLAARELKHHPILADVRGKQHWRTILNWRSDIDAGTGDVEHYKSFLSMARSAGTDFGGIDLGELAIALLQRLQKP